MTAPMVSIDELEEEAADWTLIALLLERPIAEWRERLLEAAQGTFDPELRTAVLLAQREGSANFHEVLFGPNGLLVSRESSYRGEGDQTPLMADLRGLAASLGYTRIGDEPADHILAVAGLMAHALQARADAMTDGNVGEGFYLEGVTEWLRRAHLAWFSDQISRALLETEVCYLSHVAYALELRVHPPGESETPRRRPSAALPETDGE